MPDHTPYLLDLVDTYKFTNHLLLTEIEEVQALTGAMDQLTTLRSINTSTLLSFVATIFLPANFLTGVFGTNFQQTGKHSIPLLFLLVLTCVNSVTSISPY